MKKIKKITYKINTLSDSRSKSNGWLGSTPAPSHPSRATNRLAQENSVLRGLRAVSEETRLRILHILSYGDFSVSELVRMLSLAQSSVSRHLKILTDAGILAFHREGTQVYYGYRADKTIFSESLAEFILKQKQDLPFWKEDQEKALEILENIKKKSRQYFNSLGQNWEQVQKDVLDPHLYRDKIIRSLPKNNQIILDLGCGPGALIPDLIKKSSQVIGLDSSSKMIEFCKRQYKNNSRVRFQEAQLEKLPVPSNSVDSAVASMVLHHLPHPPKAFEEIKRALKPNGVLVIVDLVKHDQEFMKEKFADIWLGFEPKQLKSWLQNYGFLVEKEEILTTPSIFKVLFIKAKKITNTK